ncbi:cyclopropane-fatty-acyl-phospholipid synthase, putative [Babesia caballi]|uniref:Cyclopropane-fatty-acyl-phospholipid synthase, putative n=1 Tax=Babesia caballi TaxID=5871 RepID=A0AAV4LM01_BABCB|nr:cyclopropane-fatty-acyl-phospholipid synthase, putative [Babesia caballi]
MKRALDEQAVKEQPPKEGIVIAKARPLQPEELELVEVHREITQQWRNNATAEASYAFVRLGLPTRERAAAGEGVADDVDSDAQYARLLQLVDPALVPDELLQAEYVPAGALDGAAHEVTDVKQAIRKIDQVMEREANYVEADEQQPKAQRDDAMDAEASLFNDHDDQLRQQALHHDGARAALVRHAVLQHGQRRAQGVAAGPPVAVAQNGLHAGVREAAQRGVLVAEEAQHRAEGHAGGAPLGGGLVGGLQALEDALEVGVVARGARLGGQQLDELVGDVDEVVGDEEAGGADHAGAELGVLGLDGGAVDLHDVAQQQLVHLRPLAGGRADGRVVLRPEEVGDHLLEGALLPRLLHGHAAEHLEERADDDEGEAGQVEEPHEVLDAEGREGVAGQAERYVALRPGGRVPAVHALGGQGQQQLLEVEGVDHVPVDVVCDGGEHGGLVAGEDDALLEEALVAAGGSSGGCRLGDALGVSRGLLSRELPRVHVARRSDAQWAPAGPRTPAFRNGKGATGTVDLRRGVLVGQAPGDVLDGGQGVHAGDGEGPAASHLELVASAVKDAVPYPFDVEPESAPEDVREQKGGAGAGVVEGLQADAHQAVHQTHEVVGGDALKQGVLRVQVHAGLLQVENVGNDLDGHLADPGADVAAAVDLGVEAGVLQAGDQAGEGNERVLPSLGIPDVGVVEVGQDLLAQDANHLLVVAGAHWLRDGAEGQRVAAPGGDVVGLAPDPAQNLLEQSSGLGRVGGAHDVEQVVHGLDGGHLHVNGEVAHPVLQNDRVDLQLVAAQGQRRGSVRDAADVLDEAADGLPDDDAALQAEQALALEEDGHLADARELVRDQVAVLEQAREDLGEGAEGAVHHAQGGGGDGGEAVLDDLEVDGPPVARHQLAVGRVHERERHAPQRDGGVLPRGQVGVVELGLHDVVDHRERVKPQLGDLVRDVHEGVAAVGDRVVVGHDDEVEAVRDVAHAAHQLLERGAGGAAAVDGNVEQRHVHQRLAHRDEVGGLDEGAGEVAHDGPADVAGGVADGRARGALAAPDVEAQRQDDAVEHAGEHVRVQEAAADDLGDGEAAAVDGRLALGEGRAGRVVLRLDDLQHVVDYLVVEVHGELDGNAADGLGRGPAHADVDVHQRPQQLLHDDLHARVHHKVPHLGLGLLRVRRGLHELAQPAAVALRVGLRREQVHCQAADAGRPELAAGGGGGEPGVVQDAGGQAVRHEPTDLGVAHVGAGEEGRENNGRGVARLGGKAQVVHGEAQKANLQRGGTAVGVAPQAAESEGRVHEEGQPRQEDVLHAPAFVLVLQVAADALVRLQKLDEKSNRDQQPDLVGRAGNQPAHPDNLGDVVNVVAHVLQGDERQALGVGGAAGDHGGPLLGGQLDEAAQDSEGLAHQALNVRVQQVWRVHVAAGKHLQLGGDAHHGRKNLRALGAGGRADACDGAGGGNTLRLLRHGLRRVVHGERHRKLERVVAAPLAIEDAAAAAAAGRAVARRRGVVKDQVPGARAELAHQPRRLVVF